MGKLVNSLLFLPTPFPSQSRILRVEEGKEKATKIHLGKGLEKNSTFCACAGVSGGIPVLSHSCRRTKVNSAFLTMPNLCSDKCGKFSAGVKRGTDKSHPVHTYLGVSTIANNGIYL